MAFPNFQFVMCPDYPEQHALLERLREEPATICTMWCEDGLGLPYLRSGVQRIEGEENMLAEIARCYALVKTI